MTWSTKEKTFCVEAYFRWKHYFCCLHVLAAESTLFWRKALFLLSGHHENSENKFLGSQPHQKICYREVITLNKEHSVGSNLDKLHHQLILVRSRKWETSNCEYGALFGSSDEDLGITGTTQRDRWSWKIVPETWGHPSVIKWLPSLVKRATSWETDQQQE